MASEVPIVPADASPSGPALRQSVTTPVETSTTTAPTQEDIERSSCPRPSSDHNASVQYSRDVVIAERFEKMYDKCYRRFVLLQDVPLHNYRVWAPAYNSCLMAYCQLWRFQQENRGALLNSGKLRRWRIGAIASKIGQLYAAMYLRTSDTRYLAQSFSFYSAIRDRGYFARAVEERSQEVAMLCLRYYARFLLVAVLMGSIDLMESLRGELEGFVEECTKMDIVPKNMLFNWQLVTREASCFCQADRPMVIENVPPHLQGHSLYSYRSIPPLLSSAPSPCATPESEEEGLSRALADTSIRDGVLEGGTASPVRTGSANIQTQTSTPMSPGDRHSDISVTTVLIVGSRVAPVQVKFSELFIDMYRMWMCFEHESPAIHKAFDRTTSEPLADGNDAMGTGRSDGKPFDKGPAPDDRWNQCSNNPRKVLLYRPTIEDLHFELASAGTNNGFEACNRHTAGPPWPQVANPALRALVLYISADISSNHGTLRLRSSTDPMQTIRSAAAPSSPLAPSPESDRNVPERVSRPRQNSQTQTMFESDTCTWSFTDLLPYCRRPVVWIVECDGADDSICPTRIPYAHIPFLSLLAPRREISLESSPSSGYGSLFTMFLTQPLWAFATVCGVKAVDYYKGFVPAMRALEDSIKQLSAALTGNPGSMVPSQVAPLCSDAFVVRLIVRFWFCEACLTTLTRARSNAALCPRSFPNISSSDASSQLRPLVLRIATVLGVRDQFEG